MPRVLIPIDLSPPCLLSRGQAAPVRHLHGKTMGTSWSVKLVGASLSELEPLRHEIEHRLDRIVAQMSPWIAESDISRFNRAVAHTWHRLPDAFLTVLDCALSVARESGGAYDPTVGPLTSLWGFGPEGPRAAPPSAVAIATARGHARWSEIMLDRESRSVLQPGGLQLDLSSVAKGYAVDLVAEYLQSFGIGSYLVEIGGELRGFGVKPDGSPWWVALERPPSTDGPMTATEPQQAIVALHGLSVATSGDYRNFFSAAGRRFSHTIDPRTGYPVDNALASVTVLHEECMRADALATAIMVLGTEIGMAFAERHDIAAVLIKRTQNGFEERTTHRFAAMLE